MDPPRGARLEILRASRHRNKLRLGHLRGNRFELGLAGLDDAPAAHTFRARIDKRLAAGVPNRFGAQRFGIGGVNLRVARAWAGGDPLRAVEWALDPRGRWRRGMQGPPGSGSGPQRRLREALARRPDDAAGALRAGGARFRRLLASAAQSAVFNAVLDARERLGLLRTPRAGDVALTPRGGPYVFPGRSPRELARTSGPLPGRKKLRPEPAVLAQQREWSAPAGIA
ncbi:MAG: tRNA pseudouridine(13) synthase TruD, partial [Proteobacteria bacterium]|nr:tRNA pseudouridine(13) synthase TruD [Pseudomonadota bacterium]